ncbi:hypothetical protein [Phnomibacter sp. MR]|uniref:hypothetical protein n=1 Tax=Phnomibacter sp. MR TaxID=3042318 RepID=UPI003A7FEBB5
MALNYSELIKRIKEENDWNLSVITQEELNALKTNPEFVQTVSSSNLKTIKRIRIYQRIIPFRFIGSIFNDKDLEIDFDQCIFSNDVGFNDCVFKSLSITESYFFQNLNLERIVVEKVLLSDVHVEWQCDLRDIVAEIADITGNFRYFNIANWTITLLQFRNPISKYHIDFLQINCADSKGNIILDNYNIRSANINGTLTESTSLSFQDCAINKLGLVNLRISGSLCISELKIIHLERFNSLKDLYFERNKPVSSVIAQTQLAVINSDLAGLIFQNVNFNNYEKIYIKTALLNRVIFLECKMDNILPNLNSEKGFIAISKHEIMRQIKSSFINQNDQVNADFFRRQELSEFFYSYKGPKFSSLYAILLFSNWGSKFGTSIGRPLFVLVLSTLILSSVLIYFEALPLFETDNVKPDLFSRIVQFGNPIRSFEPYQSGWFTVIDLLLRIINGYCIYNFLRATRRFVK